MSMWQLISTQVPSCYWIHNRSHTMLQHSPPIAYFTHPCNVSNILNSWTDLVLHTYRTAVRYDILGLDGQTDNNHLYQNSYQTKWGSNTRLEAPQDQRYCNSVYTLFQFCHPMWRELITKNHLLEDKEFMEKEFPALTGECSIMRKIFLMAAFCGEVCLDMVDFPSSGAWHVPPRQTAGFQTRIV